MTVKTCNTVSGLNEPDAQELAKIHTFTKGAVRAQEVYAFTVLLCDNEVDRDLERFTIPALHTLGKLFVGKSGIFDHSMRASDQVARVYDTFVETDASRQTQAGEPYTALKAKAYMLREAEGGKLARELEAGIKKEVSISCAVARTVCAVCGADLRTAPCAHQKGKRYHGVLCHTVLDEPEDAYEWSFVAVPAQPAAGVTKAYRTATEETDSIETLSAVLKSAKKDVTLTQKQAAALASELERLGTLARDGDVYRKSLLAEVAGLYTEMLPHIEQDCLDGWLCKMETQQLAYMKRALCARADELSPPQPQFQVQANTDSNANRAFQL